MFRKSKIEPVEKVKIVERYLAGEIGIQQIAYGTLYGYSCSLQYAFNRV